MILKGNILAFSTHFHSKIRHLYKMSRKLIHILNGDSTRLILEKSNLEGKTIVWQEIFSEGPKQYAFNPSFLTARKNFIADFFGTTLDSFAIKYNNCFNQLELLGNYREIVLWFEEDLFCQWNMLACISLLYQQYAFTKPIYLICAGHKMQTGDKTNLGDFSPDDYSQLFEKRELLSRDAILFADQFWKNSERDYRGNIQQNILKENKYFPYLKPAMELEQDRFEDILGLSKLDYKLLLLIKNGEFNLNSLVSHILKNDNPYGYGDAQYFTYLKRLEEYYHEDNQGEFLELNEQALEIINGIVK